MGVIGDFLLRFLQDNVCSEVIGGLDDHERIVASGHQEFRALVGMGVIVAWPELKEEVLRDHSMAL